MPESGWEEYFQNTHFQRLEVQFSETLVSIWDLVFRSMKYLLPLQNTVLILTKSMERDGLLKSTGIKEGFLGILFHYYFFLTHWRSQGEEMLTDLLAQEEADKF